MFRIKFVAKPEEVAAVRDAAYKVVVGTMAVGPTVAELTVRGSKQAKAWLHRITA